MDTLYEMFGYDVGSRFSCCSEIVKARRSPKQHRKVGGPAAPSPPRVASPGRRSPRREPREDKSHDILVSKMQEAEAEVYRAALLIACASGDSREAQRLLREKGEHLPQARFVRDDRGLGLVHFACAAGSLPIVKMLCEPPHNVDPMEYAPSAPQNAPAMLAARHGRCDVLEYLADTFGALKALNLPSSWSEWSSVLPEVSGRDGIEQPLLPVLGGVVSAATDKQVKRLALRLSDAAERRRSMRQYLQRRIEEDLAKAKKRLPRVPSLASTDTGGSREEERSLSRTFFSRDSSLSRSQSLSRSPEPNTLRDKRGLNGLAVLTSSDVLDGDDDPPAKREKPKRRRSADRPPPGPL